MYMMNITPSMSRRGNSYDNALAENFFSILKTECIYRTKEKQNSHRKQRTCDYFYEYNVNYRVKVLTKSRKCAAKPIRYTHLIGGTYLAELL